MYSNRLLPLWTSARDSSWNWEVKLTILKEA